MAIDTWAIDGRRRTDDEKLTDVSGIESLE